MSLRRGDVVTVSAAGDDGKPRPIDNGLRERSQVMADKPLTLLRSRLSEPIGRLSDAETARVAAATAFVIGLSD